MAAPKIVYVDHVARLSGGEIALVRLLQALGDRVEAHVVLGEDGPLVSQLEAVGATVHLLPLPAATKDVRKGSVRVGGGVSPRVLGQLVIHVWRLRRLLRALGAEVVHTNSLKAAFYGGLAGRLAGVPVVWHVRDRIAPDYLPAAAVRLVRLTSRFLPTWVVANSQSTMATLPGRSGASILNSTVQFDPVTSPATRDPARSDPARSDPALVVGVVGRLADWKGQHVFLDAFARAFPVGPERAVLVGSAMFGEEEYAAGLRAQVAALGLDERVEFRGFREDVWAELARLDILVHCSVTPEPFGQVVVEGMAAGVPVIAADAGGPAEVITDGVDGLLVSPDDPDVLAGAMRRLADSVELRSRLAGAARISSERFGPKVIAQEMLSVYEGVLSGTARGPVSGEQHGPHGDALPARYAFHALLTALRPQIICDVGSCDGAQAARFKRQRPGARVLAFEANPRNYDRIVKNPAIRRLGIEVLPLAVSDRSGTATFHVLEEREDVPWTVGASSLSKRTPDASHGLVETAVEVQTVRLDEQLAQSSGAVALWVDVEGAADLVVEGMSGIADRVVVIHIEVEAHAGIWERQADADRVLERLRGLGFRALGSDQDWSGQRNVVLVRADQPPHVRWATSVAILVARSYNRLKATRLVPGTSWKRP